MVDDKHSQDSASSSRGRVLMQLRRFLELTRDIERNSNDTRFAADGGDIDYVLDENVFEMLIEPVGEARVVRLFHSDAMDLPLPQAERDSISAQSALLTAELLFHGRLPGQRGARPLFLTEWHYAELSIRFFELANEARKHLQSGPPPNSFGHPADAVDPITRNDAEEFAGRVEADLTVAKQELQRFQEVRRLARRMIDDRWHQVLLQLRQFGSQSLTSRITPLTEPEDYRPTGGETRALLGEASFWKHRLEEELQRQPNPNAQTRPNRAIENDANTLAQVLWIGNHRHHPKRRCLLVTGDRIVFDAYRRWHVDQPPLTPFLLRRVSQYAPIINFNDTASDAAVGNHTLFVRTREAVEAAVLAFGLSRPKTGVEDSWSRTKGREFLALTLSSDDDDPAVSDKVIEFFAPQLNTAWVEQRHRDFGELKENWAKVERFAIGVNHLRVTSRWNRSQAARQPAAEQQTLQKGTESYARYLEDMMHSLAKSAITLFFPLAVHYIRNAGGRSTERSQRPIPLTLRLHLSAPPAAGGTSEDVGKLIERLLDSDNHGTLLPLDPARNAVLAERPSCVFAIASAVALRLGSWGDAVRFSDIAAAGTAAVLRDRAEVDEILINDDYYELLYLNAVANRFSLGAQSPLRSGARRNVWAEQRDSAVNQLTRCVHHHAERGEFVRVSRAQSERAAIRLFYVAWALVTPAEICQRRELDFSDAKREFAHAVHDLEGCAFSIEPKAKKRLSDPVRSWSYDQIKLQYLVNAAAAGALGHLLGVQLDQKPIDLPQNMMHWLRDGLAALDRLVGEQIVLQTDVLAYRALCLHDQEARQRLLTLPRAAPRQRLAVDQEVFAAFAGFLDGRTQASPALNEAARSAR